MNRLSRLDFPTPESPINTTKASYDQYGIRSERAGAGLRGEWHTLEEELLAIKRLAQGGGEGEGIRGGNEAQGETDVVFVVGHVAD